MNVFTVRDIMQHHFVSIVDIRTLFRATEIVF